MKAMHQVLICILIVMSIVFVIARPDEEVLSSSTLPGGKYTSKYDNINVDEILQSDRLLNNYFKCLMDQGRCTPEGTELRRILPDALATECQKCSEKQSEVIRKVIKYLVNNKPKLWEELANKYDPEKKYRMKYEKDAKELGINV